MPTAKCPNCDWEDGVPSSARGKTIQCPECGERIQVSSGHKGGQKASSRKSSGTSVRLLGHDNALQGTSGGDGEGGLPQFRSLLRVCAWLHLVASFVGGIVVIDKFGIVEKEVTGEYGITETVTAHNGSIIASGIAVIWCSIVVFAFLQTVADIARDVQRGAGGSPHTPG